MKPELTPITQSDIAALCEAPPYSVFILITGLTITAIIVLSLAITLAKTVYNKTKSKPLKPLFIKEGRFLLYVFVISILIGIGYNAYKYYNPYSCNDIIEWNQGNQLKVGQTNNITKTDINREKAEDLVKDLPEVKNMHTATFNWYEVDKKTGKITPIF